MLGSGKPVVDPELGELVRRRGMWRGSLPLGARGAAVPLAVPGGRGAPDAAALDLARTIALELERCRPAIEAALVEHREPYREGSGIDDPMPEPAYLAVIWYDGGLAIEVGYRPAWEEEHTLGARLRDGHLLELNGSVLEP